MGLRLWGLLLQGRRPVVSFKVSVDARFNSALALSDEFSTV